MGRRSPEKEAFWRLVFQEHQSSGQSVRSFCDQESLSEASFYAWRKKLKQRDQGIEGSHSELPAMIPVSVVDTAPASASSAGQAGQPCSGRRTSPRPNASTSAHTSPGCRCS